MNWWFLTLIVIMLLSLGISLGRHGQPRTDEKYNFWITLFSGAVQIWIVYNAILTGF